MFSIERFGDEHLSEDGVDVEHFVGRLVGPHPGDAVPDGDVLVLVGADLDNKTTKDDKMNPTVSSTTTRHKHDSDRPG